MQRFILAVLTTSFGLTGSAQAQHRHPVQQPSSRWVINGHSTAALGTSIGDAQGHISTSTGLGAGIEVGYRVTPRLLTYAGFDLAKQGIDVAGSMATSASPTWKRGPGSASPSLAARRCRTSASGWAGAASAPPRRTSSPAQARTSRCQGWQRG